MNEFIVTHGTNKIEIILGDNKATINGIKINYDLIRVSDKTYLLKLNEKIFQITTDKLSHDSYLMYTNGNNYELTVRSALQEKAIKQLEMTSGALTHNTIVKAPMPGMILKIKKKAGDSIAQGESILILEAMKMENDIHAPASGIVKSMTVTEGSAVEKGAILFTLE